MSDSSTSVALGSGAMFDGIARRYDLLNRIISRGPERELGRRSLVRQWCASITLLIAAVVLLSDLVTAIYMLLDGEITLRFVLKALIVAAVAGLVIAYARGEMHE